MAGQTAILEPKITLQSEDAGGVFLAAPAEWKKKLADFLRYAAITDDAEIDCFVSTSALQALCKKIQNQTGNKDGLTLSKAELIDVYTAFLALNGLSPCDFHDYPADDFDRLHDDIFSIYGVIFQKNISSSYRIKTGLRGDFDG